MRTTSSSELRAGL